MTIQRSSNGTDRRGIERGKCKEFACPCMKYEAADEESLCCDCGHTPALHNDIIGLKDSDVEHLEHLIDPMKEDLLEDPIAHNCSQIVNEHLLSESSSAFLEQFSVDESYFGTNVFTSLPSFSDFVQPYLLGKSMPMKLKNSMRDIIIESLIEFLDKNNLLIGTSRVHQALGYKALGRALLLKYPKIHKEECTSKRKRKGELGFLMSRLADRRRVRKRREMQKEKQTNAFKSSEDAYSSDDS